MNSQPSSSTKEHESPVMPGGKVILIAAAILLLAVAIFGSGCADVPAGDSGSEGSIAPDSDSSGEFVPTSELTLSTGVTVSARGLEITEGINRDMVAGKMYVHSEMMNGHGVFQGKISDINGTIHCVRSEKIHNGPFTRVEVATTIGELEEISFSVDGVSVSNINIIDKINSMCISTDFEIPEGKMMVHSLYCLGTGNTVVKSFSNLARPDFVCINDQIWWKTKLIIIRVDVLNK